MRTSLEGIRFIILIVNLKNFSLVKILYAPYLHRVKYALRGINDAKMTIIE